MSVLLGQPLSAGKAICPPSAGGEPVRELWAELGNIRNPPLHTALSASSRFGSVRGKTGTRVRISTALA